MPKFSVTATCLNGHTQVITYGPGFTREYVERQAGLMDGSSQLYVFMPGQGSFLGKCGICVSQIKCEVQEEPDDAQ